MRHLIASAILLTAIAFCMADDAQKDSNPGSLWTNEKSNPLADRTACKEGDIVTIIISEASTASFTAATDDEKTEANTVGAATIPILSTLMPSLVPNIAGATNGSLSTKTTGQVSDTGNFTATMSAVIKKVLPNGNLVIEGKRNVTINKDVQTFVLTGVVRRDDVRPDNTVLSQNLADADIKVGGKGPVADQQRKGILRRILDWLF